jgi:type II secretory pathway pseudopilin PulG
MLSGAGVLLAMFVPTFLNHVRLSKISEATDQLEALHTQAAAYYATGRRVNGKLVHGCLPDSAGPIPSAPSLDPVPVDFGASDTIGRATWNALGITDVRDLRFSYSVIVPKAGCAPHDIAQGAAIITFRAEGDLDGDGIKSLIERSATLSADQRTLVPIPPLRVERRVE